MLDWFATQRFATQNGPLAGERRLCMFAGAPGAPGTPGSPDDESERLNEEAAHQEVQEKLRQQLQTHDIAAVRNRVSEMMEHEPGKAEAVFEKTKEVQSFVTDVYNIPSLEFALPSGELTNLRGYAKGKDKEMLDETMDFLQQTVEGTEKFRAVAEILANWERSELSLEEFKKAMTTVFTGFDKFSPEEEKEVLDAIAPRKKIIEDINDDDIKKWNDATPIERMKLRAELNKKLEISSMLNVMSDKMDDWKAVNEMVRGEMLRAMPKQEAISDDDAAYIHEALHTTFEQWKDGSLSLEDLRTKLNHLYVVGGVPGKDARLAEIDKAIALSAGAKDEAGKKRIRQRLDPDLAHVKLHLQKKLGVWSQKKMDDIRAWEHGMLSNADFEVLVKSVHKVFGTDVADSEKILQEFVAKHSTWTGNVSDRIEAQEDLKRALGLRKTCKKLTQYCHVLVPPAATPNDGTNTPPATPAAPGGTPPSPGVTPPPPHTPTTATPPTGGTPPPQDPAEVLPKENNKEGSDAPPKDRPGDLDPIAVAAHHGGFFRNMGIEFYSINDMIGGFKRVIDAYKHGFHERTQLKETSFASALAKGIPGWTYLSGEVKLAVEKAADNEKDKETREFKEYLEERHFTFKEIFEGHGEESMHHLKNEPPKARAVLEYAASRGWLYDITAAKTKHKMTTLGYDIDAICSDWGTGPDAKRKKENYFLKLIGQNSSGIKSEKEHGKDKEHYTEKAKFFIDAINHALDEMNFWEAVGIAERAIERGLAGEISPWIATTVLRRLRTDPVARKYVTDQVLDQFGIICFTHTARTLSVLKVSRARIGAWLKKEPYNEATFGTIDDDEHGVCMYIAKIEKRITDLDPSYKDPSKFKELDQMVAQVFAGELVNVKGTKISIFDNDLKGYVEDILMRNRQGGSDIANEDDDYYQNVSDVIVADREVFKRLLKLDGSGNFSIRDKPSHFLAVFLEHYRKMQTENPEAAANFLAIGKEKMKAWMDTWITESRAGPGAKEQLPREFSGSDYSTKYAIFALIQEEFISYDYVEQNFLGIDWGKGAPLLAQTLMVQLSEIPNKYQRRAKAVVAWSKGGKKPEDKPAFLR